jgi:hypothetical protein
MTGLALLWSEVWELRFPEPQHISFHSRQLTYLPYLEKELIRYVGL